MAIKKYGMHMFGRRTCIAARNLTVAPPPQWPYGQARPSRCSTPLEVADPRPPRPGRAAQIPPPPRPAVRGAQHRACPPARRRRSRPSCLPAPAVPRLHHPPLAGRHCQGLLLPLRWCSHAVIVVHYGRTAQRVVLGVLLLCMSMPLHAAFGAAGQQPRLGMQAWHAWWVCIEASGA